MPKLFPEKSIEHFRNLSLSPELSTRSLMLTETLHTIYHSVAWNPSNESAEPETKQSKLVVSMMPNAPLSRACLAEATGLSAIPLRWQRQWWLCCTGSRCSRSWAQPQLTRLRGFAVTWFVFLPRWPKTRKNVKKKTSGKIRKDPLTRKYRGKVPTQSRNRGNVRVRGKEHPCHPH